MSLLITDCPRCGAKQITFDVVAQSHCGTLHNWQNWFETFCVCRACGRSTVFLIGLTDINYRDTFYQAKGIVSFPDALNPYFEIERFISIRDNVSTKPPEHLPDDIKKAFIEGAACLSIECNNAAATMFRLCVDLATRPLLPPRKGEDEADESEPSTTADSKPKDADEPQPNRKQRRDLGLRLKWLFDNGKLPSDLRGLAGCVHQDGNDGAHVGNLSKEDAEDLIDFTSILLERLFTEPEKLKLNEARRTVRRSPSQKTEA
jgi:hypothetical protein